VDELPSPERVQERWATLAARYPSQGFLVNAMKRSEERMTFPGARWQPRRGFSIWDEEPLVSREFSAKEAKEHQLRLDADDPFGEGAFAEVSTEPACGSPDRHVVHGVIYVPLPEPCDASVRFVVRLTNDRREGELDRNLYASIRHR
jgi:hypothetical protein